MPPVLITFFPAFLNIKNQAMYRSYGSSNAPLDHIAKDLNTLSLLIPLPCMGLVDCCVEAFFFFGLHIRFSNFVIVVAYYFNAIAFWRPKCVQCMDVDAGRGGGNKRTRISAEPMRRVNGMGISHIGEPGTDKNKAGQAKN